MSGFVSLVGAGLGDTELLTMKALRRIQEADVVIYDRLIDPSLLNECAAHCEKIYVGKLPKHHPVPQSKIQSILIEKAMENKNVVRLKSGDPYVFGRGGEEGIELFEAGIPFEVIPGISSSIGGLAYAGIPVTHRDYASSFHVITGHLKEGVSSIDWKNIADSEGTLVFLMGMSELANIVDGLISAGKEIDTPVAIVEWAGRGGQKTVTATLETIETEAQKAQMKPPSLIVVGDVVRLKNQLAFYERLPLFGKRIGIPYSRGKRMNQLLKDQGAEIIELTKPELTSVPFHFPQQAYTEWVFLDSFSLEKFVAEMINSKKSWLDFKQVKLLTVGHHTELLLNKMGMRAQASFPDTTALLKAMNRLSGKALVIGEALLLDRLSETIYDDRWDFLISHRETIEQMPISVWEKLDYLYFPSSKAARLFLTSLSGVELNLLKAKEIIVMGPITAKVFRQEGIPVKETDEASYDSVIRLLIKENVK